METFKTTIQKYLDEFASKDLQFAEKYKSKEKNIDECCRYIIHEARKRGNYVAMSDKEVYGLAIHYYDEKNIKVPTGLPAGSVSTSKTSLKLTQEEKEKLKAEAEREYKAECIAAAQRAQRDREEKRKAKIKEIEQLPGLFG